MGILGIRELGKKKTPAPGIQLFPYSTTRTLQIIEMKRKVNKIISPLRPWLQESFLFSVLMPEARRLLPAA